MPRFPLRRNDRHRRRRRALGGLHVEQLESRQLLTGVAADVVINEVHFDPDNKTEPVEFIELLNAGTTEVDLSEWVIRDAVDFGGARFSWLFTTFPDHQRLRASWGLTAPDASYPVAGLIWAKRIETR